MMEEKWVTKPERMDVRRSNLVQFCVEGMTQSCKVDAILRPVLHETTQPFVVQPCCLAPWRKKRFFICPACCDSSARQLFLSYVD
jgi:hypothetical protein